MGAVIGAVAGVAGIASTVSGLVGGGSAGGAGATLAGSGISAAAMQQGGDIQAAAAADALAKQEALGPSLTAPFAPYTANIPGTQTGLANLLGVGPQGPAGELAALQATPGYQFALNQGLEGVTSQASGAGLARSGALDKNLVNYSEGLASGQYQNLVQNFISAGSQNLSAANSQVTAAQGNQNAITNLILEQGQAKASGVVGAGNTIGGGIAQAGNQLFPQSQNPFSQQPYGANTNPIVQPVDTGGNDPFVAPSWYTPQTQVTGGTPTAGNVDLNNQLLPPVDFTSG